VTDYADQAYADAKQRYIRSETSRGEQQLRDTFSKRRTELNDEIGTLRDVFSAHRDAALASARRYAAALPHRVRKGEIDPPSLWERLVSLNRIDRVYREARRCADEVDEMKNLLRKQRDRLAAMEQETRRSIYLGEEAVRKRLQTPEGLSALRSDPFVRAAIAKIHTVKGVRAAEEERDVAMAERAITFTSAPLSGAFIAGIVRYGNLAYYLLCNGDGQESLLACDPALEPLRDYLFDVNRSDGGFEASLHCGANGTPERVPAHRKSARASGERITQKTPQTDQVEGQLIEGLARLAQSLQTPVNGAAPYRVIFDS
jgi:hypothetical protein